jgi:hypothetical protein
MSLEEEYFCKYIALYQKSAPIQACLEKDVYRRQSAGRLDSCDTHEARGQYTIDQPIRCAATESHLYTPDPVAQNRLLVYVRCRMPTSLASKPGWAAAVHDTGVGRAKAAVSATRDLERRPGSSRRNPTADDGGRRQQRKHAQRTPCLVFSLRSGRFGRMRGRRWRGGTG